MMYWPLVSVAAPRKPWTLGPETWIIAPMTGWPASSMTLPYMDPPVNRAQIAPRGGERTKRHHGASFERGSHHPFLLRTLSGHCS